MTLPASLAALGGYAQFILVHLVPDQARPGKTHKYPLNPVTLVKHSPHDPAIWMTYEQARATADMLGPGYMLGFVITDADPFWLVDIDNCRTSDGWTADAVRVCGMVPGAAIEVSQSDQGLHILGSGGPVWPEHICAPNDDLGFYTGKRFVALTCAHTVGDVSHRPDLGPLVDAYFAPRVDALGAAEDWTAEPVPEWSGPTDDAALLRAALASGSARAALAGRASFADLWNADRDALVRSWPRASDPHDYDASSADMALASHLAFWTGKNCARIDQLMRASALAREKWDRRPKYMEETILLAVGRCTKVMGEDRAVAAAHAPNLIAEGGAGLTFTAAAGGLIAATVANVEGALLSDESGVTVALDQFRNRLCIRQGDAWRLFKDADYGFLRAGLERRGFKPVSKEVMHTVVGMVATRRAFDSAQDAVNALQWDGVPRVITAMTRYYGVPDSPYARATAEYLFTALPGRTLSPGCQADMAVILVGVQGARKTSAVSALALDPDHFGSVNLSQQDAELAKKLRGKTIVEWAELRGLQSRDQDSIKDWITNRKEEFRDAYAIFPEPYLRRCLVVGTANGDEILDDPTGERRWLPHHAGQADVEALQRDIGQLWAEGAAMWRAGGIRWHEAERLAKEEHHKFKVYDDWQGEVERWLQALPLPGFGQGASQVPNGKAPFTMIRMLREALGVTSDRANMKEQHRAGKLLKNMGYEKRIMRELGQVGRMWVEVTHKKG